MSPRTVLLPELPLQLSPSRRRSETDQGVGAPICAQQVAPESPTPLQSLHAKAVEQGTAASSANDELHEKNAKDHRERRREVADEALKVVKPLPRPPPSP